MELREAMSFCRICTAHCSMIMSINTDGQIVDISGDHEGPMNKGYVCFKGLLAEEAHGPTRLLTPLKRLPDGSLQAVPTEQALDEIATKMGQIIGEGYFYAYKLVPGAPTPYIGANISVDIDENCQVLDRDNVLIPGLYAAGVGVTAYRMLGNGYPGSGSAIASGLATGRIAGSAAALEIKNLKSHSAKLAAGNKTPTRN